MNKQNEYLFKIPYILTYEVCGEVVALRIFGLTAYARVGICRQVLGFVFCDKQ